MKKVRSFLARKFLFFALAGLFSTVPSWGAVAIDAKVSGDQGSAKTTVSTPAFSTTSGNELLLAFISADQVSSAKTTGTQVTGAGLTWALVQRTNAQMGTAEIWRAFAPSILSAVTVTATLSQSVSSSITVLSFTGVDTSGTNASGAIGKTGTGNAYPGAPTATLVTTRNGSLVIGVGDDWDKPIARTLGPGQTLVHQYLPPVGDTYWVQMQSTSTPQAGTSVTINDTAPIGDRYNLSIVEVLASLGGGTTGSVTGTINPAGSGNNATVTLSQNGVTVATMSLGAFGSYTFANVLNGTYIVTPTETGFTFAPASQTVTVSGAPITVPVFTATATTGTVTGSISPPGNANRATVQLLQGSMHLATATVGVSGTYTFSNVLNGTYTAVPSKAGFTFAPTTQNITVNGNTVTVPVFTASGSTGTITGSITPAINGNGVSVQLLQGTTQIATTSVSASGTYTFPNVLNGTYTLIPSETGFTFTPASQTVTVSGVPLTVLAFNAAAQTWSITGTITPPASGRGASVVLSGTSSANTTTDANGNYTFTGLANGPYTVTPTKSGFAFTPASQNVTVNSANLGAINFTAQASTPPPASIKIDANVSKDQATPTATITTPGFSTAFGNELLLAFVSSDYQPSQSVANVSVTGVSGGGLTWALVKRTNTQAGTAEIWRAFASSALANITVSATLSQSVQSSVSVVSFVGIDASGINGSGAIGSIGGTNASSGAPLATLVTTRDNSWVFGVGNDYDNAINRTPGPGQSLVHQDLAPINDTFWVQMQNSSTPVSGTIVTINDVAPTTDRYNLSIVEVLPSLNQASVPDLTITKTHLGNFVQGQTGATYAITATNIGGAATSGPVTVTDTLPGGLTAAALSGTNWNCTLASLTCTRSDTLPAGASYPSITLVVNVASNAPASVTNTATISGGSETNLSNDTASDITAVTAGAGGALIHMGGASGHPVVTNQFMTFSYTPVGTNNALVVLIGCRSPGITTMSLTAPGWTFTPISGLVGPSGYFDFISTFGAITPNTAPVTLTVTFTGGNGNCSGNDTTVLVDEFSGNDLTGGTTTFDAHNESFDPAVGGICTGAPVIPANNNDAIWYGCFDNVTGVSGGYTKGQDDTTGDWTEYKILSGGFGVVQNPSFITNPNFFSFGLGGVSIKTAASVTVPVPDLTINKTHSGNFVQGQSGATYSITMRNSGGTTTSGTVTMTDTLPAGLTATAIGGTNWTCTLATLTCTRNDTLAPGASYPTVTVTVNVANNAPASVTNTATVSGGGETNTANDTASDVTSITTTNLTGIKRIQSNVNGNESGTSSMSVSFTSSNTQGDFLIVTGSAARPASTMSVQDTLGNSYTPAMGPVTDIAQNVTIYIWYVPVCKGGANTVTITPSTTAALEIHISEWSGLATVSPVDQTSSATGTGTSVSSGPQTTTINGELIFGYGWVLNTAGAGAGFTPISIVNGDLDEYEIQTTAGTVASSFVQTSGTWFALMATFKPAGGGGTGPVVNLTSPAANAAVTSKTNVSATATDQSSSITAVQFLLDGNNLGTQVSSPPYSLTWNTTTATSGTHTLSAKVFDSAGLSATAAPITVTVDNSGNTALVGSWSSPVTIPTVAVNLLLLNNNTLLFYEDGTSPTIWDYVNNVFTNIPTSADLFCSGHSVMADGRVLVVGGYGQSSSTIGLANAEIFDPSNKTWTAVPNMAFRRWYPTATTLSDGRVLVTGGWQTTNHTNAGIPEIYDPTTNKWTQLTNANNPFETYPFMFVLSDGRLIHTGGTEFATNTDILDINAQTWTVVDSRVIDGGSVTMYLPGKIIKAGSASDSQNSGPSSNTTFVLDTTQPSPAWQQTPSMAYPRSFLNLTTLPDGTVLATGGETDKNGGNISNAVYAAELWSPQTQTWTTMASMNTPREYHSTALLLPDGRVVQSGMGADFGNVPDEMTAEFYSPAYLFKGSRPTITQAPAHIQYGTNFFISTPDATNIASAVLIRTGAITHFFDQNTRYVPMTFQPATGGLTLTAPANGFLAPPGYYMLFIVNSAGVPSIARIIQLTP